MAPYTLQSPLSAGLAAASGVMAGQQAKKDKEAALKRQAMLDAQAQADTQARLGMAKSQQDATNAFRTTQTQQGAERLRNEQTRLGIEQDNATRAQATADAAAAAAAEKARREKLAETFRGIGFTYPKNWDKMSPDAKIAYLEVRRKNATQNYDDADVKAIDEEMGRVRTDAAAVAKQNAPPKPTYRDLHPQPRAGSAGGRGPDGLTPYERIELRHWDQTHANQDTSGLSAMGKLQYDRDRTIWATKYQTNPQAAGDPPNPADPRYPKKATGGGGNPRSPTAAVGLTKTGRTASSPGKPTLYEYSDGSWKP